jgi:serine/threonine protein kinase
MDSSARHQRLTDIYLEACDLQGEDRVAYLDQACGDDLSLREEVEAMLATDSESDKDLDGLLEGEPTLLRDLLTDMNKAKLPSHIGGYRVVKELGRGGFGTVYLAIRDSGGLQERVALKVLHEGHNSPEMLHRFQRENRILVSLSHPNIARRIDGGTTEDGRPYFVMEYIDGEPLDRLRVTQTILDAVQEVHNHGIVHRDLKPGNILIDRNGRPVVIDFGVAKDLDPESYGGPIHPTVASAPHTPAYAAPEQFLGKPTNAGSDLYAVGVILYELLAGQRPYDLGGLSPAQKQKLICEKPPPLPSNSIHKGHSSEMGTTGGTGGNTRTSVQSNGTSQRGGSPTTGTDARLSRQLRGDLDGIVLKALEKRPVDRYRTAEAFKEDIENYLSDRPVMAKPPNPITTAVKFVRRNRYKVSTAVLSMGVFLSWGLFAWQAMATTNLRQTVTIQELESERESILVDTLTDLSSFMSGKADRKLRTIVGTTDARAYIAEYLKQRLDRMGTLSQGGQAIPAVQLELANAWSTYADVLGGFSANLGRTEEALGALDQAILLRKTLTPSSQPTDHTLALAELNQRWTQIKHDASLVQGRLPSEAEATLLERLDQVEALLERISSDPDQGNLEVRRLDALADLATRRGRIAYSANEQRLDEAFTFWNEAEKLYQRSSQTASDLNQRYNERNRGLLQFTWASGLRKANRLEDAFAQSEAYISLCRVLLQQQNTPTAQRDLTKGLILGYLTRRSLSKTSDQPDEITELQRESQVLLEEANAISESLHTGDPEDVRSLELWAETHYNMALLQFDRKEFKSVGDITIDLVEHVQTEHARGVQNQRSVAILNAARELQRISADRE